MKNIINVPHFENRKEKWQFNKQKYETVLVKFGLKEKYK